MENTNIEEFKKQNNWNNLPPQQRIELLENNGIFDVDIFDDPESYELKPEEIDYLRKKPTSLIKMAIANFCARRYIGHLQRSKKLLIKEIKGAENFVRLGKSGAVLTCNHFSPNDSFLMQLGLEAGCKHNKHKKRMFKVIREGNYTNPPAFKFFMRHCNTLPLSSNIKTMTKFLRATNELLERGDYVLIYPEEAMWLDYKKPRPFKDGAFRFAVKNNVPVQSFFITFETENNKTYYTIHILPPIYPNKDLTIKDQIQDMKERNYKMWVEIYEDFYKTKLDFNITK